MTTGANIKIVRVSTSGFYTVTQLGACIEFLSSRGHKVYTVSSHEEWAADEISRVVAERHVDIDIPRKISVFRDVVALCKLFVFLYRTDADIVHSTTPKAGMLTAIAAFVCRVPVRLHTFTGQTWVYERGFKRSFFKLIERLIVVLNNGCFADSPSQIKFLEEQGIAKQGEVGLLGQGSLAGVDTQRFSMERFSSDETLEIKKQLGIAPHIDRVVLFMGRVCVDKGIIELLRAFRQIEGTMSVALVIAGPYDKPVLIDGVDFLTYIEQQSNVYYVGYQTHPERCFAIADVLCLPSYREGFGTVVIEAAAMGVPAVASDIYGLRDAVANGDTGLLARVRDVDGLAEALSRLLQDDQLRKAFGRRSIERARSLFDNAVLNSELLAYYSSAIKRVRKR